MKLWEEFLKLQEKRFGSLNVKKWLRSLKIIKFDACNIYLEARDAFHITWFNEHIKPLLSEELVNDNHKPIKVHITLPYLKAEAKTKLNLEKFSPLEIKSDSLDSEATLSSFISSDQNSITYKIICELTGFNIKTKKLETPTLKLANFNPIFIYGKEGVGKTHLLMACSHALLQQGVNLFFVKAQTFTDHVVKAIKLGSMDTFRAAYRNVDVLILDGIHIFSKKSATQEEFFHTFNALHTRGSQIILSANTPPHELTLIEPRLISRFEWGINLPLENLEKTQIVSIITNKAKLLGLRLNEQHINFFVSTFKSKIKAICQALEALVLRMNLDKQSDDVDISTIRHYLADFIKRESLVSLTPDKIIRTVASYYGIKPSDILGKSQTREHALPRQVAIYFCRTALKMAFTKIGMAFNRDHSTVMTSFKFVQTAINGRKKLYFTFLDIAKRLEKV